MQPYMKTKKALAGLFGLLGSFPAFFPTFLPAPTLLVFNLTKGDITDLDGPIKARFQDR